MERLSLRTATAEPCARQKETTAAKARPHLQGGPTRHNWRKAREATKTRHSQEVQRSLEKETPADLGLMLRCLCHSDCLRLACCLPGLPMQPSPHPITA